MLQEGFITVGTEKLHYLETGEGSKLLLAFHGYADDACQFLPLAEYLHKDYKVVSVDLPHHGKTSWTKDKLLVATDLIELVNTVMAKYGVQKLILAGFSMGGRVCLKIAELMPQTVSKMLLIAPDGLVFNPLYYFVTRTMPGKKMFSSFLKDPQQYAGFIKMLRSLKIIDSSRYRFAMHYLHTNEARQFVWDVWQCMRLLVPNHNSAHNLPVYIFVGKYDRVIKAKYAKSFQRGKQNTQVYILNKGHRIIDEETIPVMAECLLQ
jgi:pimeloyl-ACP methyl ester carboxylesterase